MKMKIEKIEKTRISIMKEIFLKKQMKGFIMKEMTKHDNYKDEI